MTHRFVAAIGFTLANVGTALLCLVTTVLTIVIVDLSQHSPGTMAARWG